MPDITGIRSLRRKLKEMSKQAQSADVSVVVGYSQYYAMIVHEDLSARHQPGKQAKYLETPARQLAGIMAEIVATTYRKTRNMEKSLLMACLRLQRASQEIVPIDTSALKASAFTALYRDVESAAAKAFSTSESIRLASGGKK